MSKKYQNELRRSRKRRQARAEAEVRGRIVSRDQASVQLSLPIAEIVAGVSDVVEQVATEAGLLVMRALIEEEAEGIAGQRYGHGPDKQGWRWGQEAGSVVFAGRKLALERPRVRGRDGRERPLERYRLFRQDGCMQRAVARYVVGGVAMRQDERVIDGVCEG